MSKKFKNTKLGAFLGNAAPHILDVAGDLLPDAGVLGMVKNLIEKDDKIEPEIKKVALAKTKEMYELEVKDRDSARSREVEVKKTSGRGEGHGSEDGRLSPEAHQYGASSR